MNAKQKIKAPKKCACCGAETTNPKFCSRSCATKITNRENPRVKMMPWFCQECGESLPRKSHRDTKRKYCDECNPNRRDWKTITFGETKAKRNYQIHSNIRDLARRAYRKSGKPLECEECGYNKHVVIHHKKPIGEHSDDTTIAEINKMENLMCLCPNHHWEIHNGCFYKGNAGVAQCREQSASNA